MKAWLIEIFIRDVAACVKELELFETEKQLWETLPGVTNSAGNLSLHLIGNLNHFIGATLGNTGYIRNRPLEFSHKNVPREEIIQQLQATALVIETTIENLPEEKFRETYPIEVFGKPMDTGFFLIHLTVHLNYHLGQINYLRRIRTQATQI